MLSSILQRNVATVWVCHFAKRGQLATSYCACVRTYVQSASKKKFSYFCVLFNNKLSRAVSIFYFFTRSKLAGCAQNLRQSWQTRSQAVSPLPPLVAAGHVPPVTQIFHRGRVNNYFLSISIAVKERLSLAPFFNHTRANTPFKFFRSILSFIQDKRNTFVCTVSSVLKYHFDFNSSRSNY